MTKLRIHVPPSEHYRRLVILAPMPLGIAGLVFFWLFPRDLGIDARQAYKAFPWVVCAVVSFGPMLGLLIWSQSPFRVYRLRRAELTGKGFRLLSLLRLGAHELPWSSFASIQPLRSEDRLFVLCTPKHGEASWVVEGDAGNEAVILESLGEAHDSQVGLNYRTRPGGAQPEARFVYQADARDQRWTTLWMLSGVALSVPLIYPLFGPSYFGCLLLPLYPVHALISVAFLITFMRWHPTSAILKIAGSGASFRVPHQGRVILSRAVSSAIRDRTEIVDPSGFQDRHFVLPDGSLSKGTQLVLIERLLPQEQETGSEGDAGAESTDGSQSKANTLKMESP